jgi:hypothetical protein
MAGRLRALAALAALAAGCGGGKMWPDVIPVREVSSAGGSPHVDRVRDLGNIEELPESGAMPNVDSDGVFVVGEHVLIEGDRFGKLPTVLIGGRPAGVLARTDGGGIVTKVPDGVPVGAIPVEVSHPSGKHSREIQVKRYALVSQPDGDKVYALDVGARDATVTGTAMAVDNPRHVRFAADGSVAYLAAGEAVGAEAPGVKGKLAVIALGAAGGPKVVHEVPLDSRLVVSLAVAERAPLAAVVGERSLQILSLTEPRHPAPYREFTLPDEVSRGGVVAADLHPTGKLLAVLLADGNKLAIFDLSRPESPRVATTVALLPDQRVPLVRDMRFSVDGSTLWIVSGDNTMSIAAGKQPTRLTVVKIELVEGGDPKVELVGTASVPGASAPLRLSVSRGQPLASGTTIRTPPEKAAVFVSALDARLLALATLDMNKPEGRARAVSVIKPIAEPGMLVRTDLEGGGGPLFTVPTVLSSVDLSPDSQVLVATSCAIRAEAGADQLAFEFGFTVTPLWGNVAPRFVKLADMKPDAFKPPFSIGHVRIQP